MSARKRARICAHRSNDDSLHEMIIALASRSYIRPHRHVSKSESFHIVEGQVDVAVFDDAGTIVDVIQMGAPGSGRCFYYRLSDSAFHTLIIHTDFLVIHEVTNGPFAVDGTVLADFAPPEGNEEQGNYMRDLSIRVAAYMCTTNKRDELKRISCCRRRQPGGRGTISCLGASRRHRSRDYASA